MVKYFFLYNTAVEQRKYMINVLRMVNGFKAK